VILKAGFIFLPLMIHPSIYIDKSDEMGRGAFTKEPIPANTIIEASPVIVMSSEERKLLDQTLLHNYIFEWGVDSKQCCMALGFVPVYNHSYKSNCEYEMNFDTETIRIKTVRNIEAGEELFINYNGDWNSDKKLWFDAK
jgi:uncharacterized protein